MGLPYELDLDALQAKSPAEQLELVPLLARLGGGAQANPLWTYIPHRKQRAFHAISAPVGAFVGGNRSGKSWGGTGDDLIQACDRDVLPPWLAPFKRWEEFHGRVICPDLNVTLPQVVLPIFKRLAPLGQLWRGSWSKAYDERKRILTFKNGNTIDFLTHEMPLEQFAGASKHRVRMDEEPKGRKGLEIFKESMMRILDTEGEFRMTFTPLLGLSWSYHELTSSGEPRWDADVQVVTVDMDENPHLTEKGKRIALRPAKTEAERAARKSGRWVHFAGLIYPEFDRDVHVVASAPLPRDGKGRLLVHCYESIDPGIDHPAGVIFGFVERSGRKVVYDSFKVHDETVEMIASRIHRKRAEHDVRPRWSVIDPSARNRNHQTGQSLQQEYANHGVHTIPGQNARGAGFNRVREHLRPIHETTGEPVDPVTGQRLAPLLVIMANNEELIDSEFPEYRYKDPPRGESLGRDAEPIKRNDDLLDPLRYWLMSNPTGPGERRGEDEPPEELREWEGWNHRRMVREHLKRLVRGRRAQPGSAA